MSLEYDSGAYSHTLAYSESKTDRNDFALGALSFGSQGQLNRFEYVGSAKNLQGFDIVFGIDVEEEINGPLERDNKGYYIEYISDFSNNLFLTAGARRDENDDFGDHTSFRASGAYLLNWDNSRVKFKASYGSGLRAPSLYEIDYNSGPWSYPPASNTNLSEEVSRGFEYGFEYLRNNNLRVELTAFDQEVEDAIFFDLAGFSGYLQDKGTSKSQGIEMDGSYSLSDTISFTANYTYNDTERPNGLQRIRRPKNLFNFGLNYQSSSEKLRLNAFYRGSRDSVDEQFGSVVDLVNFEVLDITGRYQLSSNVEIFARIENVLNEKYQEVIGYISPERASYLGVRLNF
jgi:vitamin B12 transporter